MILKSVSNKFIIWSVICFISIQSFGQDKPLINQYLFNTQVFNPATVGEENQSNLFLMGEYMGLSSIKNNTFLLSYQDTIINEKMGIGVDLFYTEFALESTKSLSLDYSYNLRLADNNLRFGITSGLTQYLNPLTEYELYPDNKYDRAYSEDINLYYIPIGAGIYYDSKYFFIGISNPNIYNIYLSEFGDKVYRGHNESYYYLYSGFNIQLSEKVRLQPTSMVYSEDFDSSVYWDISLNFIFKDKFWIGGSIKSSESYSFLSRWKFNNGLGVGFSYSFWNEHQEYFNISDYGISLSYDL